MFFLMLYSMSMVLTTTTGSEVRDEEWVKEFKDTCSKIDYSEYCDKIGECEAGTHLFCMYYKPSQLMGPSCQDGAQMVGLTQENKEYIMERINAIRAEVATGVATGENDVHLPRGYGIVKLSWDSELATLAQLWANQCRFDYGSHCVATKKFQNPCQIQSLYRYTYPDWQEVNEYTGLKGDRMVKNCLTPIKVEYTLRNGLNALIRSKERVKKNEVQEQYLGLSTDNQYLVLVNGNSTHIGCAMASYREYHWKTDWKNYDFHAIHLVCYLSALPHYHKPLYAMKKGPNVTEKCGCPIPDYEEDEDCLCVLSSQTTTTTEATTSNVTGNSNTTSDSTNKSDSNESQTTSKGDTTASGESSDTSGSTSKIESTDTSNGSTTKSESTDTSSDSTTKSESTDKIDSTTKSESTDTIDSTTKSENTDTIDSTTKSESTDTIDSTTKSESTDKSGSTTKSESTTRANGNGKQNCAENPHQKQPVVVLPIFTFENAPPEEILYPWRSNSTSKAKSRRYNWHDFQGYPIETATPKKSIFSGVATFGLRSQTNGMSASAHQNNPHISNDSILANKDLKNILHNVPRKDRSRLEELFLKFILEQNHISVTNENELFRPVENYHVLNQADAVIPNNNRNIDEDNFKEFNHKSDDIVFENPEVKVKYDKNYWLQHSRRTGNLIESTEIGGNDNKEETESQLVMPVIRKLKPLMGGKQKVKHFRNNNNEKIFNKDEIQKKHLFNMARNNIRSVKDKTILAKLGTNTRAKKISKDGEESNINNHNSVAVDDLKLKRRAYLNNEISKLKNKLKHFRNLRRNDVNKKERFRPLVASRSERKNTKLEEVNNFYMPDRAHPLHDF